MNSAEIEDLKKPVYSAIDLLSVARRLHKTRVQDEDPAALVAGYVALMEKASGHLDQVLERLQNVEASHACTP